MAEFENRWIITSGRPEWVTLPSGELVMKRPSDDAFVCIEDARFRALRSRNAIHRVRVRLPEPLVPAVADQEPPHAPPSADALVEEQPEEVVVEPAGEPAGEGALSDDPVLLLEQHGLAVSTIELLLDAGLGTVSEVISSSDESLLGIKGIGSSRVADIRRAVKSFMG